MNESLAWYMYPEPRGTHYDEKDLMNPHKVVEVFDYCQILLAYITKSGWEFLVGYYGYEVLYDLDTKSGWQNCESIDEYKECIAYEMSLTDNIEI